jgi:hypothetical protein
MENNYTNAEVVDKHLCMVWWIAMGESTLSLQRTIPWLLDPGKEFTWQDFSASQRQWSTCTELKRSQSVSTTESGRRDVAPQGKRNWD